MKANVNVKRKPGRKTGPGVRGLASRRRPALDTLDAEAMRAEHAAWVERFRADSPLRSASAKQALAEQLATLLVLQRELQRRLELGALTAEEARSMPGVASNARRIAEALGLTAVTTDDGDLAV